MQINLYASFRRQDTYNGTAILIRMINTLVHLECFVDSPLSDVPRVPKSLQINVTVALTTTELHII